MAEPCYQRASGWCSKYDPALTDAFCSECLSLMVDDHGAGHLCPVCDEHDDCDTAPCSGDAELGPCALNKPLTPATPPIEGATDA